MADYGEIARELIRRNVGETRFQEICQRFGLSSDDEELMDELVSRWKPDDTLDGIVALCEEYKGQPNVGRVMQALEAIAWEAVQRSAFRRQGRDN